MTSTYSVGERVLCYHGPLVYEAKILKYEIWDEGNTQLGTLGPHCFVHYKGWKQTWDEWVPLSRLLKFTEQNIVVQKQLHAQAISTSSGASSSKASKTGPKDLGKTAVALGGSRKEGTRGTKRGREEDDGSKRPDLRLNVPETLKVLLVDDWEAVTKNSQLVRLPRSPNVQDILRDYSHYVPSLDPPLPQYESLLPTITAGLQLYFDRSIGANLLYRFERPQYAETRKKYVTGPHVELGQEKEMSSVYGAEHLLRMLVSLPSMVSNSSMDPDSVGILKEYVHALMNFMIHEKHHLFLTEYETASSQYQNLSRT